ncbi:hypothetical protein PR048_021739 [Dryococelus australis]|uniref:Uncharacterized protein n=1 Tax=Dryococelus australis TaxID=614101 RepID=A0ABQ9GZ37_9NEOP|nr:hypothetical protein PR048_021739 [Dryococelus australis]
MEQRQSVLCEGKGVAGDPRHDSHVRKFRERLRRESNLCVHQAEEYPGSRILAGLPKRWKPMYYTACCESSSIDLAAGWQVNPGADWRTEVRRFFFLASEANLVVCADGISIYVRCGGRKFIFLMPRTLESSRRTHGLADSEHPSDSNSPLQQWSARRSYGKDSLSKKLRLALAHDCWRGARSALFIDSAGRVIVTQSKCSYGKANTFVVRSGQASQRQLCGEGSLLRCRRTRLRKRTVTVLLPFQIWRFIRPLPLRERPDLTPLWGRMKSTVYEIPVETDEDLLARVMVAAQQIDGTPGVMRREYRNIIRRYDVCNDVGGRDIEPLLLDDFITRELILSFVGNCPYRREPTVSQPTKIFVGTKTVFRVKSRLARGLSLSLSSLTKLRAGVCSGPYTTQMVAAFVSLCGLRKFPSPDRKEHIAQRSGRPARPGTARGRNRVSSSYRLPPLQARRAFVSLRTVDNAELTILFHTAARNRVTRVLQVYYWFRVLQDVSDERRFNKTRETNMHMWAVYHGIERTHHPQFSCQAGFFTDTVVRNVVPSLVDLSFTQKMNVTKGFIFLDKFGILSFQL